MAKNDNIDGSLKIGFIGGGMMAEAIIRGLLEKEVVENSHICVSEPMELRRKVLNALGVLTTENTSEMLHQSTVVFIAVKPDIVKTILKDIEKHEESTTGGKQQLFISICAGVKLSAFEDKSGKRKVVRVMPNQPCVVTEAASAFSMNSRCTEADRKTVQLLMEACGMITEVLEKNLDVVTGLSGSGPGFVFMMIEAMTDAAVLNGLDRDTARKLAAQTVLGAAKMTISAPDVHIAELRNRVESPGGTTIAGTAALERHGFRAAVIEAVTAATQRSVQLGK